MSKGDILRGFVTERLAAATQDILGAVERIVAGYEEEASGFRQEIERQRRQLEALLQPLNEPGVKCSTSLGPEKEEEGEDEEGSAQNEENPTDQAQSRSVQHRKMRNFRPQITETQTHVDLKIQILQDSQGDILSKCILNKGPTLRLKFARGLKETEFLNLLKSTFPQLSGDNSHFDMLIADRGRRLRLLNIKTVTPDEIHRNISSTTRSKSTLYIRTPKECQENIDESKHNEDSTMVHCYERSTAQQVEGSRDNFISRKSTVQKAMEMMDDDDDEDHGMSKSVAEGNIDIDREEEVEKISDDKWRPNESKELKGSEPELQSKTPESKTPESKAPETKVQTNAVLSCKVCRAQHQSELEFAKHAWSHMDDPGSICGLCGESFVDSLKDHLESHHRSNDCHICGETFLSILSLNEHVAAHSGEQSRCKTRSKIKRLLCGVCGKSLSNYRSLTRHKMTHSGERPHSCQVCGRRFKLPGTLRQHEKIHTTRERSYLCDVCCKMYLTSKQLQIHMRTHTNDKPYRCGECGKGFITKGPLTIHMRVHTGETPYHCPDCGWSFKRKANLDNHMRVHSGSKPFVCGICGKACARKTYLTVHMRTHNGERPYKCILCDKAFTQSHCLKTHMRTHLATEAAV
ncbi:zinc finger protein 37-like isoform X2 [Antennarius striatus]|uniref:zinc finger protein 37-like isoform X2 n=1 Tax=Antennarius striatus TaxID=241820 RepID=UPI0035B10956